MANKLEYDNHTKNLSKIIKNLSNTKITLKKKPTAHLFGLKFIQNSYDLDLSYYNNIIEINYDKSYVRVGGSTNLANLITFLYNKGYGLKIIPDMDHLTIGGLYAGIGGGARTFKYGAFFNIVEQVEILTGNGDIIICNKNNHSEIFNLLPSTLGTLGYALSLWLKIEKIKPFVYSKTISYNNYKDFIENISIFMEDPTIDFLDSSIFNSHHFVIIIGKQVSEKGNYICYGKKLGLPYDIMVENGYEGVYTYLDYIYRWDVDGYYSFRGNDKVILMLRNKYFRKLLDKRLFRETRLRKLGELFGRKNFINGQIKEQVGDYMIPIDKSEEYFIWYNENVGLYPLYICPINFPFKSPFINTLNKSIDFGVGYGVIKHDMDRVHLLRICMLKAYELGGDMLKYNSIYKSEYEFWNFYDKTLKTRYYNCKNKYDLNNRYFDISTKLIME